MAKPIEEQLADRAEIRNVTELLIRQRGKDLYESLTKDERTLVQFGMFPAKKTSAMNDAVIMELTENGQCKIGGGLDVSDVSRLIAVGCMDGANAGSQKMVV